MVNDGNNNMVYYNLTEICNNNVKLKEKTG